MELVVGQAYRFLRLNQPIWEELPDALGRLAPELSASRPAIVTNAPAILFQNANLDERQIADALIDQSKQRNPNCPCSGRVTANTSVTA
jgi:hypothetical protein